MIQDKFKGLGAAMITPFDKDGNIDYEALGRMTDYVIDGGVDYVVALGTTAETPTLYIPERAAIADFIKRKVAKRVPLVIGAGGNSTSEVLDQLREIDLEGADAILSVTPYYNKPSQEGLYRHFERVAEASPLPIILYNIPGRSGVNMLPETTLRIARDMPNVIGIKEASGNIGQIERIIKERDKDFLVIAGDDGMAIDIMQRGGDGVISVAANLFPEKFGHCISLAAAGDFEAAKREYEPYGETVSALFAEGNPTGIKCALKAKGLIGGTMRLPLVEGTPALYEKFRKLIETYDLR
ncbi:MAG: 4-hydroxy-tetrahydrodipicolinate synthase [Alistipes sp.]|nr:4-hydroxy-tetrahydrodipicolinate synthase [Alistipes sp.]